jgi:hypothetical protein
MYGVLHHHDVIVTSKRCGTRIARRATEAQLAENEDDELTVVPMPSSESQAEHDRIRRSNDAIRNLSGRASPRATTKNTTKADGRENA